MLFSQPARSRLSYSGQPDVAPAPPPDPAPYQPNPTADTQLTPAAPEAEPAAPEVERYSRPAGSEHASREKMRYWEPYVVFLLTLAVLAFFTQRVVAYLTPPEGDEPFYLMTDISILQDGDLNECNNYIQLDESKLYPSFYSFDGAQGYAAFPDGWVGWRGAPFPLPPHPTHLVPASRECASNYLTYPVNYDNPTGELYSKHGLGLSLLVLPAFALGGRLTVVFFLNLLGALLAANIYLFAREGTGKLWPAILTWVAFAFTVPLLPYSYLIFPELPAALLILYAFRRIRLMNNNWLQITAVGLCVALLPWLHYRFAPVAVGLVIYYFFQDRALREKLRRRNWLLLMTPAVASALLLMLFFYQRYGVPLPNADDHAGINDVAGTIRGAVGVFLDQQWGLFVAAPVFILAIVGVILMAQNKLQRQELAWMGVVAVPYFLIVANYAQWWGEWCPPARYLAPVLPLLALPFAYVLVNIHSILYKAIYGVLLLLSLLTTWGFLYQPQWMYNQPDGKSLLLVNGLPQLASALHLPFLAHLSATQYLPSFVSPYYAYFTSKQLGDAAASAAWRASIWPITFIFIVVLFCLVLAHFSRYTDETDWPGDIDDIDSAGGDAGEDIGPERLDGSPQVVSPVSFRLLVTRRIVTAKTRMRLARQAHVRRAQRQLFALSAWLMPRPAFAWATPGGLVLSREMRFQTASPESEDTAAEAPSSNGQDRSDVLSSPWVPETRDGSDGNGIATVQAPGQPLAATSVEAKQTPPLEQPQPTLRRKPIPIRVLGAIWRVRGLWAGLIAVGIAMYAQKLTTVDRQILQSIHWYALATAVLLVGWLGTYKNRSMLVVPIRREKKVNEPKPEIVPANDVAAAAPLEPEAPIAISTNGHGLDAPTDLPQPVLPLAPLPTRKRASSGETSYVIPVAPPPVASEAETLAPAPEIVKRPLRSRTSNNGIPQNGSEGAPNGHVAAADGPDGPAGNAGTILLPQQPVAPALDAAVPLAVVPAAEPTQVQAAGKPKRRNPFTRLWRRLDDRFPGIGGVWWRYLLAFAALGLNIYSVQLIRRDYYSALGGWSWVASLVLLLVAFLGERRRKVRDFDARTDIMERTDTRISRKVEIATILIIFAMGLSLRLLNLGDMTTGMHGDEGEAGVNALDMLAGGTLEGHSTSPFLTGWFLQPNFYYWGIALMMKVFGTDLFGLRMFSALAGSLMILPFYGLVRIWFGVRTAIIAALLLAFSDVAIHFSKAEFSNITTPLFLTTGFFFLFRGLGSKRTIDYVLSGYGFMLSLYFYMGARLTPIMVLAVIGYIFLLLPIVRIPGSYFAQRALTPTVGRLRALGSAIRLQAGSVVHYFGQLLILAIACFCFSSPWLVYYLDNQTGANSRTNDKVIFNNAARMASQYQLTHDPLYVGIRMPTGDDVYPFLPVVFEKTPLSVQVVSDGFWQRAMWDQLTTTLSIFTYRADASSVYTFTGEPVSKPIEAALLILGLAWAMWRWRDTRMGVISIWFWSTILAGGMLTIDAPYMARIVGVIPLMALLAALPLSKLSAELLRFVSIIATRIRAIRPRKIFAVTSQGFSASVVGVLLLYLAFQNYGDYFLRYIRSYSFPEVTGQAYFVRQMNAQETSEGRPIPYYYDVGIHFIYWEHGDNRFLNNGTPGTNMVNPSDDLPILDNGNRDVVFMVWALNASYMDVIKTYYPNGKEAQFLYGPNGTGEFLFNYYVVSKEEIAAHRQTLAKYTPATGPAIERDEPAFGTASAPPVGLAYPVAGTWTGNLVAPSFGRYQFSLDSAGAGSVVIDGTPVLTTTTSAGHAEGEVLLARGPHAVTLTGTLANASSQVNLQWAVSGQGYTAIPRTYLYDAPSRGLLGQVRSYTSDLLNPAPQGAPGAQGGVYNTRVDGFLGFRDSPNSLQGAGGLTAVWTGTLDIKTEGNYSFDTNSNGDSIVLIDNNLVVNNIRGGIDPHQASGQVELTPGPHTYELRYNWSGGTGYLEAYWTPPGSARTLIGPDVLHTTGGIVNSSQLASEPPPVQLAPDAPPKTLQPDRVLSGDFLKPRGLAVDKAGNIYVGDRGNHHIVVYSPDGKVISQWGTAAPQPKDGQPPPSMTPSGGEFNDILDVAVGDDGTVYVLDNTPRLQAFTSTGTFLGSIEAGQLQVYAPNGLTSVPSAWATAEQQQPGAIIAVTGQNRLLKLPPASTLQANPSAISNAESITISQGDSLEQPVDSVGDPTGNGIMYAIDLKDRIVQLTPQSTGAGNGQHTWSITKQWHLPVGRDDGGSRLAISPDGKTIYMSDPDRHRVAVVNVGTGKISYFGTSGHDSGQFTAPSGIAVGADGKVYVLDRENNNVQVFDLSTQQP